MENKTAKYFKYAIGEIVLVVIGILIALGINNWNQKKIINRDVQDFSNRLLEETRININQVDNIIEQESKQINSCKQLLELFHYKKEDLNSKTIDSLLWSMYNANTVVINTGTYTEGLNTGIIGKIKSDKLRSSLYNFVAVIQGIRRREEIDHNDLNSSFSAFLYKHINYRNIDAFSDYKNEINKTKFIGFSNLSLLENMEFENYIDNRYYGNRKQLEQYQYLKLELKRIESLIKMELEK